MFLISNISLISCLNVSLCLRIVVGFNHAEHTWQWDFICCPSQTNITLKLFALILTPHASSPSHWPVTEQPCSPGAFLLWITFTVDVHAHQAVFMLPFPPFPFFHSPLFAFFPLWRLPGCQSGVVTVFSVIDLLDFLTMFGCFIIRHHIIFIMYFSLT